MTLTPEERAEARRLHQAARDELARVCAANFTMRAHIPVQPDDSDEVISRGLELVPRLLDALDAAEQANAQLAREREDALGMFDAERYMLTASRAQVEVLAEALRYYARSTVIDNDKPWKGGTRASAALDAKETT